MSIVIGAIVLAVLVVAFVRRYRLYAEETRHVDEVLEHRRAHLEAARRRRPS